MFLFVQTPFDAVKQSHWGVCYEALLVQDRNEQGLLNAFMQLSLRYFRLYFQTGTALASLLLPIYPGRCHSIRETIQHCVLQICFLACTSLFSIKSNVLKLDTAQKVYSVNKGLFLGVFSLPWFACIHGQVPRCNPLCFGKLC